MIATNRFFSFEGSPKGLSPLVMAFMGDGVYDLLVRGYIISQKDTAAKQLHQRSVEYVSATAQTEAYNRIVGVLTAEEGDVLRRGRNATARVPKSASSEEYHKATALEALFGYLYLDGQHERIAELFEIITQHMDQIDRGASDAEVY